MTLSRMRHYIFGRMLPTSESPHQTISKTVGLAVFASDSLSSVAYAGGEILLMLAVLGASHFWLAIPITVAIAVLLLILTFSYRQTIFAYPSGGGIPGHADPDAQAKQVLEGWGSRFGEASAWLTFGLIALMLPVVLWWIFMAHG